MMDSHATMERIGALIAERFHIHVPGPEVDLMESGVLDSMQFVELLLQLEEEFGLRVRVEDIELDDLRTLARLARLVTAEGAAANSSNATSSTATP